MKKITLLFLTLIMCVSLCACGGNSESKDYIESTDSTESTDNTEKIETALNALWIDIAPLQGTEYSVVKTYMFEGGKAVGGVDVSIGVGTNVPLTRANGTYEINDEKIVITWNTISEESEDLPAIVPDSELTYQYKDNTLHLTSQDGKAELDRQNVE